MFTDTHLIKVQAFVDAGVGLPESSKLSGLHVSSLKATGNAPYA